MAVPAGEPDLEALKKLLESAHELVSELAHGSTERTVRALADIPPDEREVIATTLERAAASWKANEAFTDLHQVRLRANPHAQLFIRILDPVSEPTPQDFDVVPEATRMMRRLGMLLHPEFRAVWEAAVTTAREHLTPEERADCVRFLERALTLVKGTPPT
jgi:hypothetical protein